MDQVLYGIDYIEYYIWYIQKAEREAKIQQSFRQILRGNEIYLARF